MALLDSLTGAKIKGLWGIAAESKGRRRATFAKLNITDGPCLRGLSIDCSTLSERALRNAMRFAVRLGQIHPAILAQVTAGLREKIDEVARHLSEFYLESGSLAQIDSSLKEIRAFASKYNISILDSALAQLEATAKDLRDNGFLWQRGSVSDLSSLRLFSRATFVSVTTKFHPEEIVALTTVPNEGLLGFFAPLPGFPPQSIADYLAQISECDPIFVKIGRHSRLPSHVEVFCSRDRQDDSFTKLVEFSLRNAVRIVQEAATSS